MKRNHFYPLLVLAILTCTSCRAQKTFSGTLTDWSGDSADVVSIISMDGEPLPVGEIQESGEFKISLEDNFLEKIEKAMGAYNEGQSQGEMTLNTLEKAFSCYEDGLQVENGDQKAVTLGFMGSFTIANIAKKKMYGDFMISNSADFARAFPFYDDKEPVKGYYLDWYYVKEPATVKGECSVKTYALNQKEFYNKIISYQLDFKKGWNVVKISADAIFTDRDGKKYVSQWTYTTLPEIPAETKYIFLKE